MHRLVLALVLIHSAWAAPMKVAVFVALCDNATQGIQPVPKAIGDGDKPETNLYWGCTEGFGGCFRTSKTWKLQKKERGFSKRLVLEEAFQKFVVCQHEKIHLWK